MIEYKARKIEVFPSVYEPSDDTFLLLENLEVKNGDKVLDVCTGTGILAIVASENASKVIACDISSQALKCTTHNMRLNNVKNMKIIESNLFEKVNEKFDLILLNPPYLPSDPDEPEHELKKAWDGGRDGREIVDRFIDKVDEHLLPRSRVQLVQSSLNNTQKTLKRLEEKGLKPLVVAKEKYFFEELFVITAERGK